MSVVHQINRWTDKHTHTHTQTVDYGDHYHGLAKSVGLVTLVMDVTSDKKIPCDQILQVRSCLVGILSDLHTCKRPSDFTTWTLARLNFS